VGEPITIRAETEDLREPLLFSDVFVPQGPRWSRVLPSAAAHGLVIALVPTLVQALSGITVSQPLPPIYKIEIMRLQLPDKVYSPAVRSHRNEANKAEKPAEVPHSEASRPAAEARSRPPASRSRSLELPLTHHASDREPVILQPDEAPLPKMVIPVAPPVAFWTKTIPPVPRPQAVIPGRVHATSATPNLDAPPVLSQPSLHPVASDIAAALAAAQSPPKLPLPNSSTSPIRVRGNSEAEIASFDVPGSDPVNLIYLEADARPQKQLVIPKGMQNTPASKSAGESGMTTARASDNSTSASDNSKRPDSSTVDRRDAAVSPPAGAAGTARTAGVAAARPPLDNGQNTTADVTSPSDKTPPADSGANHTMPVNSDVGKTPTADNRTAGNVTDPAATHAPDRAPNSSAGVIRVAHPVNGNFDVVILQSVSRDDLPDVAGTLSGNPVYTVYLKVGDEREWLLEYCIPTNVTRAGQYQVNIDDSGAVSAPYPLTTVIPKNVVELPHPKHIVLHGLLGTAGVFREINGPDAESPLVREVLPLLREWQFRPAMRDRVPVEVEVLLIIPARS
jgi:hypothetical protein